MPVEGFIRNIVRAICICAGVSLLVACDSSTSRSASVVTRSTEYVISGAAVNGPLAFAEVSVYAPDGRLLGQTTTGADGHYHLTVHAPPPYRVAVQGGMLDEVPYAAALHADCDSGVDCNVTPFTTTIARLVDEHGFNVGDAHALLSNKLSVDEDPFVSALVDGEPQPEFDLDQVREFIDGGERLDAWVAGIVDWVRDDSSDSEPPLGIAGTVAVTANASSGGSIDPTTRVVRRGERAQFVVTPLVSHRIASVTGCGGSLDGNVYTTEPLSSACTVEASFSLKDHAVTAAAGEGGTIDPATSSVAHGSRLTLNVRPENGFRIREVVGCGGELSGNVYTTAPITSSCTVTASFDQVSYVARAIAGPGGSIAPSTRDVVHGERTSFQLIAHDGYHIAGATGCGGTLNGNIYTTAPLSEACTVTASFAPRSYLVAAHATDGGRISPPTANVTLGEHTSFTVAPEAGYRIDAVEGCGGQLVGNTYRTGPITSACSVNARFAPMRHTVTADAGEGGVVSPPSRMVAHDEQTSFTLTPEPGYHIESVTGCNGSLSGDVYTTDRITAACTVAAKFALNRYSVTATSSTGGSIDPRSATVAHGERASFTLTPDAGYAIDTVTGCAGTLNGDIYTTAAITADCAVTASFARKTYLVSASAGEGGSIAPASSHVAHGESIQLTISSDHGYRINTVSGCSGHLVGETYTTGAITANCTVNATFARHTYTVTAHAGAGGSIAPSSAEVEHGQHVTFDVIADAGYRIANVSGCAGHLADGTYTTGAITADCSLTASFETSLTAPANFTAEPGDRRITLRWDPVEDAETYDVYHAREPFDPENYSVYEGGTLTTGVPSAPHAVTDLVSDTEYFFSVRARAGAARGQLSALLSAKTFPMCFGLSSDDPGACSGNGTCVAQDTCKCDGIYSGRRCDQEMIFDYGSDEYTWPTRIPIYLPIQGKPLDPTDSYVWAYEVLANGWFDMNPGFAFGLAIYPPPSGAHELGSYSNQWAYRGLEGHIATADIPTPFGRPVGEIGDRILLKYDGPTNTLSFYTKLAGEDTWTLEGGGAAFTNVAVPKENELLRPIVTIACIAECAIRVIPPGPDAP